MVVPLAAQIPSRATLAPKKPPTPSTSKLDMNAKRNSSIPENHRGSSFVGEQNRDNTPKSKKANKAAPSVVGIKDSEPRKYPSIWQLVNPF